MMMVITQLIIASKNGDKDIVLQLIQNGADINMQNNYGCTALVIASKNNRKDIVNILKQ